VWYWGLNTGLALARQEPCLLLQNHFLSFRISDSQAFIFQVFGGSWGQHVILKNSSVENHKFNVLAI
jgi:hypothetical protein